MSTTFTKNSTDDTDDKFTFYLTIFIYFYADQFVQLTHPNENYVVIAIRFINSHRFYFFLLLFSLCEIWWQNLQ